MCFPIFTYIDEAYAYLTDGPDFYNYFTETSNIGYGSFTLPYLELKVHFYSPILYISISSRLVSFNSILKPL